MTVTAEHHDAAEQLIRKAGARLTQPRLHVLRVLLASGRALTHQDVVAALEGELDIDRVTAYRVLEWLTEARLAHRIAHEDRVWRFSASPGHDHAHAHFVCARCGQTLCLDGVSTARPVKLPKGYQLDHVEITAKGHCPNCK